MFDLPGEACLNLNDLLSRVDAPERAALQQALATAAGAGTLDAEHRFAMADGSLRRVRITARAITDTQRERELVGTFTDMQQDEAAGVAAALERQRMDAALRESEERFRHMAETTPDVIWITELHPERVVYVSPSFKAIWGHDVEALYRNPRLWTDVIHPEDIGRVVRTFAAGIHARGGSAYDMEFRLLRADGGIRWIFERAVFIADAHGRPYRVSGISSDITERKRAEAALLESQERFALALAASSDGIWDWDLASDAMFMSGRAQSIYGLVSNISTRPWREWRGMLRMHAADGEQHDALLAQILAGQADTYAGEWRVMREDGGLHWVRIRGQGIRDAAGRMVRLTGSVSDIDMHKRTEAALQQARRLEATGTLAAGIAHDFNNILGIVLGYGEKAARGAPPGSRLRSDLDTIISAGERGRTLVERILTFSRTGARERIAVHAEAAVRQSLALFSATLPAGIRIETSFATGRAAMLGDPTDVHQVVANLVSNAIHALGAGGLLRVSLRLLTLPAARVASTGMLGAGPYIVLAVEDEGTGIAPEVLERIFDPFFTTKDFGVGTGLGLSLVHGIVAELGGAVDVASRAGAGSCFSVYLPHAGEAAPDDARQSAALPRGRGQQILIVDDEEPLLRLVGETLRELDYIPRIFTSSLAALAAFRAAPHAFDAVLTDERMPGMSGSTLITHLRAIRPEIPVLMMSGYPGENIARGSAEPLADEILRKPVAMHDLALGLAKVLERVP